MATEIQVRLYNDKVAALAREVEPGKFEISRLQARGKGSQFVNLGRPFAEWEYRALAAWLGELDRVPTYAAWLKELDWIRHFDPASKTRIFVYGTLRKGCHNHDFLKGSKFVGMTRTLPHYRMVAGGIPFLCRMEHNAGDEIVGELYDVDGTVFTRLAELERGYDCAEIMIQNEEGGTAFAYAYFAPPRRAASLLRAGQSGEMKITTDFLPYYKEQRRARGG